MARLLAQLQSSRALLSVTVPGTPQPFTSALLAVDAQREQLILDELSPRQGHLLLVVERQLRAEAQLHGVRVRFSGVLTALHEDAVGTTYRMPLPAVVHYAQRRASHRAHVGLGASARLLLTNMAGDLLEGRLRDLSTGGACAELPTHGALTTGELLSSCTLELPSGATVTCAAEVRFIRREPRGRELRVGLQFVGLTSAQQRLINQCIALLERESLRTEPASGGALGHR